MGFPPTVRDKALTACARHCCICHKFCGIKIELHHIVHKSERGKDSFDNRIPLCFDCHGDMRSYDHKHPKGAKYTTTELIKHRNNWYSRIQEIPIITYSEGSADLDREMVDKIKELLPPLRGINFVRQNNFAGFGFRRSNLDDLHTYLASCEDPAFEFIDAELESMRASLTKAIGEFTMAIAIYTYPTGTGGRNISSVPQDWEITQRDQFNEAVAAIHRSAKHVCENYDGLIKACRRKLGR